MLLMGASAALANAQGGVVAGGQATINQSNPSSIIVNQSTDRAIINWGGFDIGRGEAIQFVQPGSGSITLNRVNSGSASQINGAVSANGNLVIINPSGVIFGQGATVNVNGLIATTAGTNNNTFMAGGKLIFDQAGDPNATVSNAGAITAGQAGLVGLVAPNVINSGVITANLGRVHLASGDTATVDLYGDRLMEVAVSDNVTKQLVSNSGTITADGGTVALTAAAGSQIVNSLITNSGSLQAQSVGMKNGEIVIYAEGSHAVKHNIAANKDQKTGAGTILVQGTLDASGLKPGEHGGTIKVLGDEVAVLKDALLNASGDAGGGTVKVGGDFHGAGITPTALTTNVAADSSILANAITTGNGGDVTVWSDNKTLFAGNIQAKGGAQFGNGGFVETSGKQILSATGLVDASASHGTAGTWLLDPNDITIQAAGPDTNVSGNPDFTTTDDSAIVTTGSIETALNAGTSVTIHTGSGGGNSENGNITVNDSITKSSGVDATLTLEAANNIFINSSDIISTSNKLNITLDADHDASGSGAIAVWYSSLLSNGGNIILGGGANPLITAAVGSATHRHGVDIEVATLNAAGGNISILGNTTQSYANGIETYFPTIETSGSGTITLAGTSNAGGVATDLEYGTIHTTNGAISITGAALNGDLGAEGVYNYFQTISTINGNITINGSAGAGNFFYNTGIFLDTNAVITATGTGNISITGIGGNGTDSGDFPRGNDGIIITDNGGGINSIRVNSGNLSITGIGNGVGIHNTGILMPGGAVIDSTGSGSITLTGYGPNGAPGIVATNDYSSNPNVIGSGSMQGNINLITNSLITTNLGGITTTGNITFKPYTLGASVGVGTGAGTLSISDGLLGLTSYSSLTIGSSNTGNMDINSGITYTNPTIFQTGSGYNLTLSSQLSSSAPGNAFVLAPGGNFINHVGALALNMAGGGNWLIYSTNPARDTTGSLAYSFRRFSCVFNGACPPLGSGNGLLYADAAPPPPTIIPNTVVKISQGPAPILFQPNPILLDSFSESNFNSNNSSSIFVDDEKHTQTSSPKYADNAPRPAFHLNYSEMRLQIDPRLAKALALDVQ